MTVLFDILSEERRSRPRADVHSWALHLDRGVGPSTNS